MLTAVPVALLLLSAQGQPRAEKSYLVAPWLGYDVELAAGAAPLREAVRGEPIPPGLVLADESSVPADARDALHRGQWREAAGLLRQHAEATPSAVGARFDALVIEIGLGVRQPSELLQQIGGAPVDARTAALFWDARALLVDDGDLLQHARTYLHRFARVGGGDRQVLAEIEIGRLLWEQACGIPEVDGTCGAIGRVDWNFGCDNVAHEALLVIDRDAVLVREAQRILATALKRARRIDRTSFPPARARALRDATSTARWLIAESIFEALLRLHQPPGLRLDVDWWRAEVDSPYSRGVFADQRARRESSMHRFREFYERKYALFQQLERRYAAILADTSPVTAFAALLRSSQAMQDIALQLWRTDEPPFADQPYSFCHEEDTVSSRLRETASKRLELCAALAVDTGHVDAWAARCQRLLEDVDPDRYPAAPEITSPFARPGPRAFGVVLEPAP